LQSTTFAYISDCTSDGSRAKIFSRFTGVFYLGFSAGPVLAAFLIKHPFMPFVRNSDVQSVTPVFWVAMFCSFINLTFATLVFPESLTKEKRAVKIDVVRTLNEGEDNDKGTRDWMGLGVIKNFLSPLALFLPKVVQGPEGKGRKDWSLTFSALALFGYMLSTGLWQIKYMYAGHVYEWGAAQLGYYISWLGGLRAAHLLFVLPCMLYQLPLCIYSS